MVVALRYILWIEKLMIAGDKLFRTTLELNTLLIGPIVVVLTEGRAKYRRKYESGKINRISKRIR